MNTRTRRLLLVAVAGAAVGLLLFSLLLAGRPALQPAKAPVYAILGGAGSVFMFIGGGVLFPVLVGALRAALRASGKDVDVLPVAMFWLFGGGVFFGGGLASGLSGTLQGQPAALLLALPGLAAVGGMMLGFRLVLGKEAAPPARH